MNSVTLITQFTVEGYSTHLHYFMMTLIRAEVNVLLVSLYYDRIVTMCQK